MPVDYAISQLDDAIDWVSSTTQGLSLLVYDTPLSQLRSSRTLEGGITSKIATPQGRVQFTCAIFIAFSDS